MWTRYETMARLAPEEQEWKDAVHSKLSSFTKHTFIRLTNSGNAAIFSALALAKESGVRRVLVPDQGGWFSYRTYPGLLGLELIEVPTDAGLLSPETVESVLTKYSTAERCCLLVPSFAGYFAEQDVKELAASCHEHGALLIEDASGALSDNVLCNGHHSDFIVASFGSEKLVNLGYGGMLSSRLGVEGAGDGGSPGEHPVFSMTRFHPSFLEKLPPALDTVPERLTTLLRTNRKVLKQLDSENIREIVHPTKRGINVALRCSGDMLSKAEEFCTARELPYLKLPRYHRAKLKGLSIELKRM